MHSSRMRTGRSLTVFRSLLLPGGGDLVCRGVYLPGPGGCTWSGGVYLPGTEGGGGGTCLVWGGWVCTWSGGCTSLVWGGGVYLPGPRWGGGVYLPGPRGGTWSRGGVPAWSQGGVPGPRGCTWSRGDVPAWSQGGVPAWSGGVYLPGPRGLYLVPGGCTCLVQGRGCTYLVPGACTCLVLGHGVYLPGPGGCTWSGGYLPGPGGGVPGQVLTPVNRMTHRCKNITLAKTSFRPVTKLIIERSYHGNH